jgi:hypothetical protein
VLEVMVTTFGPYQLPTVSLDHFNNFFAVQVISFFKAIGIYIPPAVCCQGDTDSKRYPNFWRSKRKNRKYGGAGQKEGRAVLKNCLLDIKKNLLRIRNTCFQGVSY